MNECKYASSMNNDNVSLKSGASRDKNDIDIEYDSIDNNLKEKDLKNK